MAIPFLILSLLHLVAFFQLKLQQELPLQSDTDSNQSNNI